MFKTVSCSYFHYFFYPPVFSCNLRKYDANPPSSHYQYLMQLTAWKQYDRPLLIGPIQKEKPVSEPVKRSHHWLRISALFVHFIYYWSNIFLVTLAYVDTRNILLSKPTGTHLLLWCWRRRLKLKCHFCRRKHISYAAGPMQLQSLYDFFMMCLLISCHYWQSWYTAGE